MILSSDRKLLKVRLFNRIVYVPNPMNGHEIKEETNERQTRARSIVFVAPTNVLRREGTRRFCG